MNDISLNESSQEPTPTRVREVLRLGAKVSKSARARKIILDWLEERSSQKLPTAAIDGEGFNQEKDGFHFAAIQIKGDNSNTWALRYIEPEEDSPDTIWIYEIAIREQSEGETTFSLRTLIKSCENKLRLQPEVPSLVDDLISECGLKQGSEEVETGPWVVDSDDAVENLIEYLTSPKRQIPAIVITVPEESEDPESTLLDPVPLAESTIGIAKVIVLPADHTWKLTNRFGKRLSVYRGAVRLYLPGFKVEEDSETGHNLFLAARMETPENARTVESLLRWLVARESLKQFDLGKDIISFASVLLQSVEQQQGLLEKKGSSKELVAAAKELIPLLSEELSQSIYVQQWLEHEHSMAEERAKSFEAKWKASQFRSQRFQRPTESGSRSYQGGYNKPRGSYGDDRRDDRSDDRPPRGSYGENRPPRGPYRGDGGGRPRSSFDNDSPQYSQGNDRRRFDRSDREGGGNRGPRDFEGGRKRPPSSGGGSGGGRRKFDDGPRNRDRDIPKPQYDRKRFAPDFEQEDLDE